MGAQLLVLWGLLSCSLLPEMVAVVLQDSASALPCFSRPEFSVNNLPGIYGEEEGHPYVSDSTDRRLSRGSSNTIGFILFSTEERTSRDLIPDRYLDVKHFPDTIAFSWYCFHIQDKDLFCFWWWDVIVQSSLVGEKTSLWSEFPE